MYSISDLQKLVQMLAFLGYSPSPVSWGGGPIRPGAPTLYQFWIDTTLGPYGQPVYAAQVTPSVIWCNMAGVPV